MKVLVVKNAFGGHGRGSTISDPSEIEAVLAGENACHVIVSDHPEPEPLPSGKKSKSTTD